MSHPDNDHHPDTGSNNSINLNSLHGGLGLGGGDSASPSSQSSQSLQPSTASAAPKKRRRITRACDDCRRRRIKCDGQKPCSSCAEFNAACTYNSPVVRGQGSHSQTATTGTPNNNNNNNNNNKNSQQTPTLALAPAAKDATAAHVHLLEQKLHAVESVIRHFLPQFDLSSANSAAHSAPGASQRPGPDRVAQHKRHREHVAGDVDDHVNDRIDDSNSIDNTNTLARTAPGTGTGSTSTAVKPSRFVPLVGSTDQLSLTDSGEYEFHGYSSGAAFLSLIIKQFPGIPRHDSRMPFLNQPHGQVHAPPSEPPLLPLDPLRQKEFGQEYPQLPPEDLARDLCQYAFSRAACLLRVIHAPSFWKLFDRLYSEPSQHQDPSQERRFLGLLYSVIALGSMYDVDENDPTNPDHYDIAMQRGYRYYAAARLYLHDLTECSDTTTLQALTFIIQFLQSAGNLNACHTFIGIALRSALRMGFHRHLPHHPPNTIKDETRRRVFHTIRQMDIYLSTTLGLPLMLHDRDIDQPWPTEVNDEYITDRGIFPPPYPTPSFLEAFNAHTKLMHILAKVVERLYPPRGADKSHSDATYMVSYARVRAVEKELQEWHEQLPSTWRPGPGPTADIQITRVKILLRFAYAHVQLVLYRPFLQYYSRQPLTSEAPDARFFALATTGIKVCRNIIHIGLEIQRQAVLIGPYWFITYTQFFAILSLVLHVMYNPDLAESAELFSDAKLGKDCITSLTQRSLAADRISTALDSIFEQLPERLREGKFDSRRARGRMPGPTTNRSEPAPTSKNTFRQQQAPGASLSHWTQGFPGMEWAHNQSSQMPVPAQLPISAPDPQNQIPDLGFIDFALEDPFAYPLLPGLSLGNDLSSFQEDALRLPAYNLHTDMEGQLLQVQDPLQAPWFSPSADLGGGHYQPRQGT